MKRFSRVLISAVVALSAAAAMARDTTQVTYFGQAAFQITTPKGIRLLIDPWFDYPTNPYPDAARTIQADYILLTHGHAEHVGQAIEVAQRTGAKLITNTDLMATMLLNGYPPSQANEDTNGNWGGSFKLSDELTISLVRAAHSSDYQKDLSSPIQPGGNPLGFVIKVAGGPTIYHTGDTDVFSDMALIKLRFKPDVMLAAIGGRVTMDPEAAALAVTLVGPKLVVPMHYGCSPRQPGTPDQLRRALREYGNRAEVAVMQPGETRGF